MKSRIIPPKKQAVCYNLPKRELFISVLKEAGADIIPAGNQELSLAVSEILESNPELSQKDEAPLVNVSFLALSGFSGKELDALLQKLRVADPERQVLKAVVTAHNKDWSLKKLILEVEREHKEFLKRDAKN